MKSIIAIILLTIATSVFAATLIGGEADGRTVALAEAIGSTQTGPMSIWSNPAGLLSTYSASAFLGMHRGIGDVKGSHLAGSFRKEKWAFGMIARTAESSDLERRDLPTYAAQGTFGVRETNFGIGIANAISSRLSAGYSAIYRYDRIEDDVATEWRHSLGMQMQWNPALRSGFAFQQLSLSSKSNDGVSIMRAGTEYRRSLPFGTELCGAADLQWYNEKMRAGLGVEWTLLHVLSLRCGYRFGFDSQGLTYGVGAKWKSFSFDMGVTPFENDLGSSTKISIRIDG
ncbi:MAG: hypothetical protein OEM52_06540 [bacterium]|nr:hypothetical protein [bacterium]